MSFPLHKQVRLYRQKRREYERNERRWRKLRMQWHFMRRDSYLRFPVNGNLLEALDGGRAEPVLGDVRQHRVEGGHGRITATPIPVSHSGIGEYASARPGAKPSAAAMTSQVRSS